MSLIVKICGLSTADTLEAAIDAGADMVGFVFFPASPRNLDLDLADGFGRQVRSRAAKVALTVDADDDLIDAIVETLRPTWFQFHGSESPERVRSIKRTYGLPVMKAIGVAGPADLAAVPDYAAVADRILFDARPPKDATRPGGLGEAFDWELLRGLDLKLPFLVSGGINAGNVAEALRVTGAQGVDVSSGVESSPGEKNPDLIRDFIRAARAGQPTS
jgi:phosphoribosylanthranilate isomerase